MAVGRPCLAVRPEHARGPSRRFARGDEGGRLGAGTGTPTFGFKAGIGGASRITEAGVLAAS